MKCYIFYKHIQDILYFVVLNIKKIKKEFILNKWLITILNIVQNIKCINNNNNCKNIFFILLIIERNF